MARRVRRRSHWADLSMKDRIERIMEEIYILSSAEHGDFGKLTAEDRVYLANSLRSYAREFGGTGVECACGCGQLVTSPRPEAKYASNACRVRALRARRGDTDGR